MRRSQLERIDLAGGIGAVMKLAEEVWPIWARATHVNSPRVEVPGALLAERSVGSQAKVLYGPSAALSVSGQVC